MAGDIHVSRVNINTTQTASTNTVYGILKAVDDPDYTLQSDGTNIANCETGARVLSIKLHVEHTGGTAGQRESYLLYKDQRNQALFTAATDVLNASPTSANQTLHRLAIAFYQTMVASGYDKVRARLFSRKGMIRNKFMNDTDQLELLISNGTGASQAILVWGTVTWIK